jgi:hypothetical protein
MMTRSRFLWLCILSLLNLTSCVVVVEAPRTPTPGLSPIPASPSSPTVTPVVSPTSVGAATTQPSPTLPPTLLLASDTPAPTESAPTTTPPSTPVRTTPPISITTFTASPPEIRPGESLTLTWSVIAQEATLWQLNPLGQLSIWYSVPLSGSLVITNTAALRNQVSFVLFATSGGVSAQAFASARIICPDTWFFADPPGDCPASPPHYTLMQAEHFEHGFMLWTQWNDFIYILFADSQFSPRWDARQNAWFDGMPLNDPGLAPPPGFFQPVRGFGVAWRDDQATPGFRVRDRLGWATDEEFRVDGAAYQCNSAPKYNTCYLTGPGGVTFVLEPERSGWRVWTGP